MSDIELFVLTKTAVDQVIDDRRVHSVEVFVEVRGARVGSRSGGVIQLCGDGGDTAGDGQVQALERLVLGGRYRLVPVEG